MSHIVVYGGELYHYGVKGMKWGVRHYQYKDGSYMPGAEGRYAPNYNRKRPSVSGIVTREPRRRRITDARSDHPIRSPSSKTGSLLSRNKTTEPEITSMKDVIRNLPNMKLSDAKKYAETYLLGKNTIDHYIKADTNFSRIQANDAFEKYAFYATYKKHDIDFYTGLFGSNLINRANAAAKYAEKHAKTPEEKAEAKRLREIADSKQVYKMNIGATKNMKVASDSSAANALHELLKDKSFRGDVATAIKDAKTQMRRPGQQMLFNKAQKVMNKSGPLTENDKKTLYEAFNLTLTFHNDFNNRTQDKYYSALKKKGYSAIVDVNDQKYSSYHAKSPMIVFDHDAVQLNSAQKLSQQDIDKHAAKANRERILREIGEQTVGNANKFMGFTMNDAEDYIHKLRRSSYR